MDLTVLWAVLAIGLTGIGATIGEGLIGAKSLDVLSKNPDLAKSLKWTTILWLALTESAAIYGLLIAILILFTDQSNVSALAAWGLIGAVWLFTCIYESIVVKKAIEWMLRNPASEWEIKSNMILYVAITESAAIYALLISILILFAI